MFRYHRKLLLSTLQSLCCGRLDWEILGLVARIRTSRMLPSRTARNPIKPRPGRGPVKLQPGPFTGAPCAYGLSAA
jgi:hypothetical protein